MLFDLKTFKIAKVVKKEIEKTHNTMHLRNFKIKSAQNQSLKENKYYYLIAFDCILSTKNITAYCIIIHINSV